MLTVYLLIVLLVAVMQAFILLSLYRIEVK